MHSKVCFPKIVIPRLMSNLRLCRKARSFLCIKARNERQDVSSKNMIDEMADAITGGKDMSLWALWPANRFFLTLRCKPFLKHDVPQQRKDWNLSQKCTTSLIRRQNHNGEVVDRSWLCFSPSRTCVKSVTCRLKCAATTKCAHFPIRKGIFDWKHTLERLRSHEHSMEHIDQCRGKAAPYPPVGGATIRRGPRMYIVLVS